jgi:hypothetical protein
MNNVNATTGQLIRAGFYTAIGAALLWGTVAGVSYLLTPKPKPQPVTAAKAGGCGCGCGG